MEDGVAKESSWLCADEHDRKRLLEMAGRLETARMAAFAAMAVTLLACGPWLGFGHLAFYALAAVVFRITDRDIERRRRPEYWMFAGWAFCQLMIAVDVMFQGGAKSVLVFWLGVPTVTLAARFTGRGQRAGIGLTAMLILVSTIVPDPALAFHEPYRVIAPLSALFGLAALSAPLMHSDVEHRVGAVTDALTGLANRAALEREAPGILAAAAGAGQPVAVLVGDLDRFKVVNDTHGHDRGDVVLREAAAAMQSVMRSFDRLYRLGGEEFLVILRGADLAAGHEVAERLRVAVEERRPGGLRATLSLGVSAGTGHEDLTALMRDADRALYGAKRAGRNRVETAEAALAA